MTMPIFGSMMGGSVPLRMVGLLGFLAIGCASEGVSIGGVHPESRAPVEVIEYFLTAARAGDLRGMAELFGTREGTVLARDPISEVEVRMHALASLLENDGYTIEEPEFVPGRLGGAVEIPVRLEMRGREFTVPFTLVRTDEGRWLIERIGLEGVTSAWSGDQPSTSSMRTPPVDSGWMNAIL